MSSQVDAQWTALCGVYETLCKTLPKLAAELRARPLAHFLRPDDPCVPEAVVGLTLDEVSSLSFHELRGCSGVGRVKITNLTAVLGRLIYEGPLPNVAMSDVDAVDAPTAGNASQVAPADVTELVWEQWRAGIRNRGLGAQTLGRFVERLHDLPRGLWFSALDRYLDLSLAELHALRGYGAKRIGTILETFQSLNELFAAQAARPGELLLLGPPRIAAIDAYLTDVVRGRWEPTPQEVEERVVVPLLEQIRIDAVDTTYSVVLDRLGLNTALMRKLEILPSALTWRERLSQSRQQQILSEVGVIMHARWPRGESSVGAFLDRRVADLTTLSGKTIALCFPRLKSRAFLSNSQFSPRGQRAWS